MLKPKVGWRGVDRGILCIVDSEIFCKSLTLTLTFIGYTVKWSTFSMLTFLRALSLVFNVSYFNVINYNLSINIDRFEALNCHCSKTTGPIFIKFTELNEWAYKSLYSNFQVILNFYKNL